MVSHQSGEFSDPPPGVSPVKHFCSMPYLLVSPYDHPLPLCVTSFLNVPLNLFLLTISSENPTNLFDLSVVSRPTSYTPSTSPSRSGYRPSVPSYSNKESEPYYHKDYRYQVWHRFNLASRLNRLILLVNVT